MNFALTDEQEMLRRSAREFLSREWDSPAMRRMLDEPDEAAEEFWSKIAALGWPGLLISEEHEGLGLGWFDLAVLMEEMGRRLIPGAFFSSGVLAATALERLGSEQAKAKYLPRIAAGEIRATLAVWETARGWDLSALALKPERVEKRYVPDAAAAELLLAAVRTGDNEVELLIPADPRVRALPALDPTRALGEVFFGPAEAQRAGSGSLEDLQSVLDLGAAALSAEMVGGAAELLDQTVSYVKSRKQFGRPVGSFQAVQHRAADMLIHVEKARSAALYAAIVADEAPDELERAAATAKAAANQAYVYCSQQAIQLHGGIGFTWEQDLHLYLKRAKSAEYTLGDTSWNLDRVARSLGVS